MSKQEITAFLQSIKFEDGLPADGLPKPIISSHIRHYGVSAIIDITKSYLDIFEFAVLLFLASWVTFLISLFVAIFSPLFANIFLLIGGIFLIASIITAIVIVARQRVVRRAHTFLAIRMKRMYGPS